MSISLTISADNKVYEVRRTDSLGLSHKIKGFRYYDRARRFAEKLSREGEEELIDYCEPVDESLPEPQDNATDTLMRVLGYKKEV